MRRGVVTRRHEVKRGHGATLIIVVTVMSARDGNMNITVTAARVRTGWRHAAVGPVIAQYRGIDSTRIGTFRLIREADYQKCTDISESQSEMS